MSEGAATVLGVRGNPTPEELATVLTVLLTQAGAAQDPAPTAVSRWSDRAALLRAPLRPGAGAWRAVR